MEKNDVVKSVQANGTFDFNGKTFYKYEVEMENGDIGENLSKTPECRFKEGQQTDYEFIDGQFPKIKPVNTFQPKAGNSDVQDNIRFAQGLNIANLQFCHGKITEEQIDDVAFEMYEKLKKGPQVKLPFEKTPF